MTFIGLGSEYYTTGSVPGHLTYVELTYDPTIQRLIDFDGDGLIDWLEYSTQLYLTGIDDPLVADLRYEFEVINSTSPNGAVGGSSSTTVRLVLGVNTLVVRLGSAFLVEKSGTPSINLTQVLSYSSGFPETTYNITFELSEDQQVILAPVSGDFDDFELVEPVDVAMQSQLSSQVLTGINLTYYYEELVYYDGPYGVATNWQGVVQGGGNSTFSVTPASINSSQEWWKPAIIMNLTYDNQTSRVTAGAAYGSIPLFLPTGNYNLVMQHLTSQKLSYENMGIPFVAVDNSTHLGFHWDISDGYSSLGLAFYYDRQVGFLDYYHYYRSVTLEDGQKYYYNFERVACLVLELGDQPQTTGVIPTTLSSPNTNHPSHTTTPTSLSSEITDGTSDSNTTTLETSRNDTAGYFSYVVVVGVFCCLWLVRKRIQ